MNVFKKVFGFFKKEVEKTDENIIEKGFDMLENLTFEKMKLADEIDDLIRSGVVSGFFEVNSYIYKKYGFTLPLELKDVITDMVDEILKGKDSIYYNPEEKKVKLGLLKNILIKNWLPIIIKVSKDFIIPILTKLIEKLMIKIKN